MVVNGSLPYAQTGARFNIAVSGGRIQRVGGMDVLEAVDAGTRVIDADGGAVLPGINDAHLHFFSSAMVRFGHLNVDSQAAGSWAAVAKLIEDCPAGADGWIRAHGWDELHLGPGGPAAIDECRPGIPVVAFDKTGHQLLANRTALQRAGITASTPAPAGGILERHDDGTPTGKFVDGAMELMTRVLPNLPPGTMRSAASQFQRFLHAQGITSLTEPGLGPGAGGLLDGSGTTAALDVLADLALDGTLSLRINTLLLFAGTGGVSAAAVRAGLESGLQQTFRDKGIDPARLRIAGVKVFADGTPRSGTAWMSEPYGHSCKHGSLVVAGANDAERVAELDEIIRLIESAELQAGIHATGDAATAAAVTAVIRAQQGRAGTNRHYIIHGSFASNASLPAFAANSIGYSTNPMIRFGGGAMLEGILGQERFRRHQPLASAAREGVKFNLASDSPVTTTDWRRTMLAAITRATVDHPGPVHDGEGVGLRQALAGMTSLPAWQDHAEHMKGSVRPGMAADLCILDGAWPNDDEPDELMERHVMWTVSAGQVVHEPAAVPATGFF